MFLSYVNSFRPDLVLTRQHQTELILCLLWFVFLSSRRAFFLHHYHHQSKVTVFKTMRLPKNPVRTKTPIPPTTTCFLRPRCWRRSRANGDSLSRISRRPYRDSRRVVLPKMETAIETPWAEHRIPVRPVLVFCFPAFCNQQQQQNKQQTKTNWSISKRSGPSSIVIAHTYYY